MGLIPDDVIAEIRARADIVAVIGQHMQLRKAGRNWKGLCPFHGEKTASFNVSPDKGFFYCFGCHKKGDVFTFVMEYQGKSFHETAEVLAAQCGVTIPETQTSPEAMRARGERSQMLEVNKLAAQFFRDTLAGPAGQPGRAYLEKRGTSDAMRDRFQLGYAPGDWHALADFLEHKRVDMELAVKVGLVVRQPRAGGFYDRFRDRLVCPVVMPGGEIAGFSARLVGEPAPDAQPMAKYINSPESPVYKKSKLLFGLAQAREAMGQKKRAVLVEGNFDVISMHQAGFDETVAPLGTSLTAEQIELLRRMSAEVVVFYDGDRAGRVATRAALELCLAADVPVRVAWRSRGDNVALEGQDPDTLLKEGRIDVEAMIKGARDGLEAYTFALIDAAQGAVDARAKILDHVAKLASRVAEPLKRDVIAGTLAMALDLDQGVVRNAMARVSGASGGRRDGGRYGNHGPGAPGAADAAPAQAPVHRSPPPIDEVDLVALLADHPSLLATADANGVFSLLTDERLRDMYSAALRGGSLMDLAPTHLPASSTKTFLEGRYASASDPQRQLLEQITNLRKAQHQRSGAELERQLGEARRRGDAHQARLLVEKLLEHHKTGR